MTGLDSDQSSYKQSDEEDSDPETDVEDVEFSGTGPTNNHPSLPHSLTLLPPPPPPLSLSLCVSLSLSLSLSVSLAVGGKKKPLRMVSAVPTGALKPEVLPPLLSRVNGTIHVSIT